MSNDRVDKNWQKAGLEKTSTQAILSTLKHYGVEVDEKSFRDQAQSKFPFAIASDWKKSWRGTGQFSLFPFAAAIELWRRLEPDRLLPGDYLNALGELMEALGRMIAGAADAPVEKCFQALAALRSKVPMEGRAASSEFVGEVLAPATEDFTRVFDSLAERLAQEGHIDDAEAFADVEEFLMSERAGVSKAMVRAAKGEKEAAVNDLAMISQDPSRKPVSKVIALDGLIHLSAFEQAQEEAERQLDAAEKAKDFHIALGICGRLAHILEQAGDQAGLKLLEQRASRIAGEHETAHPEHRRAR
jgi:hypothetical protein